MLKPVHWHCEGTHRWIVEAWRSSLDRLLIWTSVRVVSTTGKIKDVITFRRDENHIQHSCAENHNFGQEFKISGSGGGSLAKNAGRNINLTKKRSGLLDSALPLARTMTSLPSLPLKLVAGAYTIFHHCSLSHQPASDRILAYNLLSKSDMLSVSRTSSPSSHSLLLWWAASVSPGSAPSGETAKL